MTFVSIRKCVDCGTEVSSKSLRCSDCRKKVAAARQRKYYAAHLKADRFDWYACFKGHNGKTVKETAYVEGVSVSAVYRNYARLANTLNAEGIFISKAVKSEAEKLFESSLNIKEIIEESEKTMSELAKELDIPKSSLYALIKTHGFSYKNKKPGRKPMKKVEGTLNGREDC